MTHRDLISVLKSVCDYHTGRFGGNSSLIYGDLLVHLPNIISPHCSNGEEFYIGIRSYGLECCHSLEDLNDRLSIFLDKNIVRYCVTVIRLGKNTPSYVLSPIL